MTDEGFIPKRRRDDRLPPGQYETRDFPVLSMGPTPEVSIPEWKLEIVGAVENPMSWNWEDFKKLPTENVVKDIHCVTKWSKFDTKWRGVMMDTIFDVVKLKESATHIVAHSYDGYETNVPIEDLINKKAMIAIEYDGEEIEPEHGGPARLLVPHLYFWKSAKWIKKIEVLENDRAGFWETRGYHNYGNPWNEERYWND